MYRNSLRITVLKTKPEKAAIFMSKKKSNIEVSVIGNVDKALRQLKKKIEREGVVRDMKRTVYFEPATQKRENVSFVPSK